MNAIAVFAAGAIVGSQGTARWVVIAITVAAFIGAWLAVHLVRTRPLSQPLPGMFDRDIVATDLLAPDSSMPFEPRIVGWFESAYLGALIAYALFDRGFAWFHIPGTPLFVGELVLVLGLVAMLGHPTPIFTSIRRSPPLKLLTVLMAWGLVLLVYIGVDYGVDAIRDSALWYYGAFAVLAVFLIISNPRRIRIWMEWFAFVLPWVLGWLFFAVVLDATLGGGPPFTPDSQVSIFSHSSGNTAIIAVIGLAFVWLVDNQSRFFTPSRRMALTAVAGTLLLLAGLKNRGGFVAGILGIIGVLVFMRRNRSQLVVILVGVGTLLLSIALVSQVSVALFGDRDISAEQLMSNITSIVSPGSGDRSETTTTEWRLALWARVFNDVNSEVPITGYGPGPDLGRRYNVTTNEQVPLRNPHNSHLGVLSRLGWVGFGVWITMWGVWALVLLDLRSRLASAGRSPEAGIIAVVLIGAGMMLVNAFFDPSLEGPQVAIWLWFLFGTGAALQLVYHGFPTLTHERRQATGRITTPAVANGLDDHPA